MAQEHRHGLPPPTPVALAPAISSRARREGGYVADARVLLADVAGEEDGDDDEGDHERGCLRLVQAQHAEDCELRDQHADHEVARKLRPQLPPRVVARVVDVDHLRTSPQSAPP
eukprot:839739-Rhodomonas_salina.2